MGGEGRVDGRASRPVGQRECEVKVAAGSRAGECGRGRPALLEERAGREPNHGRAQRDGRDPTRTSDTRVADPLPTLAAPDTHRPPASPHS